MEKKNKERSSWLILPLLAVSLGAKDFELMFGWLNWTWTIKIN